MSLSRPITAMVACTCDAMQLESAVHADTIFIVQRRDGDVMISLFAVMTVQRKLLKQFPSRLVQQHL